MLHATTTDETLLTRIRDWREEEGWCEFYRRYSPAILAHARRSGLSREEAEDVVQTTMTKVATYIPTFEYDRTVARFRTWLNQIVNQRILAIWHQRRRCQFPEKAWVHLKEMVVGQANSILDPVSQAELEHRMLDVCLARVRGDVKPRHWQIFEANSLLGFSAQEVAQRHRTTPANVWIIRHRLICRLRSEWKVLLNNPFVD